MKLTKGEKAARIISCVFITLFALTTIYPFWYVIAASLSSGDAVQQGRVFFAPVEFTMNAYKEVMSDSMIPRAYLNSFIYTASGTLVSILLTISAAYPLSKARLKGRTFLTLFIAFTMWFGAGTIPIYLNFRSLNLLNNPLAIIIGFAVTPFYVIILRTYFQGIPDSLEEAAKIDGASDIYTMIKIYLPLSVPSIMTLVLYYMVQKWNGYFWAMVLLTDEELIPLQVLLTKLITEMQAAEELVKVMDIDTNYNRETIIYATIVVAVVPMLIVYPFIQKYFVKGVMVGSIKG